MFRYLQVSFYFVTTNPAPMGATEWQTQKSKEPYRHGLYTFSVKRPGICKHSLIALKMLVTSCSSPLSWLGLAFALVGTEFPYTGFEARPSINETFTELVPTSIPRINSAKSITRCRSSLCAYRRNRSRTWCRWYGHTVYSSNYCCGRLNTKPGLFVINGRVEFRFLLQYFNATTWTNCNQTNTDWFVDYCSNVLIAQPHNL